MNLMKTSAQWESCRCRTANEGAVAEESKVTCTTYVFRVVVNKEFVYAFQTT